MKLYLWCISDEPKKCCACRKQIRSNSIHISPPCGDDGKLHIRCYEKKMKKDRPHFFQWYLRHKSESIEGFKKQISMGK